MRGILASCTGVACATVLVLPLAQPTVAAPPAVPATDVAGAADVLPGHTQSLPLAPLTPAADDRAGPGLRYRGGPRAVGRSEADTADRGLPERTVRPFSLVGVVWDDPDAELHGSVQVRTRAADGGPWSVWQDVETHNHEHAADPDAAESGSGRTHGSTAPLWVGLSDGVQVRVRAEIVYAADADGGPPTLASLPDGLRIDLVDPGAGDRPVRTAGSAAGVRPAALRPVVSGVAEAAAVPATGRTVAPVSRPEAALTGAQGASSAVNAKLASFGANEIPALDKKATEEADLPAAAEGAPAAKPYIGPRPRIVTRKGWGADEKLRESKFGYTKTVKAAFVHHSATGNNYRCADAPAVLRGIYRFHVKSSGWRDFGYNFAVDKCGTIYEGRAGGVAEPVMGAHTLGFNTNSMGVAVLGTYTNSAPPKAAVSAVAQLTAWKLGLFGANPRAKVSLVSGGGNLYKKGRKVNLDVISGHRDGFATECPGGKLYKKLGSARSTSAKLQGR